MVVIELFYVSFLAVVFCAIRWGERPERFAAKSFGVAAVLSWILHGSGPARWDHLQFGVMTVDALLLAFLLYLSARFERWWIIIITAMQVLSTSAHLGRIVDPTFRGLAYSLMESMSAWAALPLLAIALLRTRRHRDVRTTSVVFSPWPDVRTRT